MLQQILSDELQWKLLVAFIIGCIYLLISLRLLFIARSEGSALKKRSSVTGIVISVLVMAAAFGWWLQVISE